MITNFRRLSQSKVGTGIVAGFFIMILAGFAIGDISNFGSGKIGFGLAGSNLAAVGDQQVLDRDMTDAMQRRLQEVRRQRPEADYSTIASDFNTLLNALIDQRSLLAFADKYGIHLSKRLIDAEIAQIPQTKGLNGKFSDQQYQAFLAQQRMTDAEVREIISGSLLQRAILTPVATNARVAVGMAMPYASMLLEAREGEAAALPIEVFRAGLKPSDADLQRYYSANRDRYMVPEQRSVRIARISPDLVAGDTASDKEVADYYNANKATFGAKETRDLSQAVVPDQATANAIAAKAKGGASLSAAAGANAAVTSLSGQSREAYSSVAGAKAAASVFTAAQGAIIGPVQSDFGWVVVKVEGIKTEGGRSLDQARGEIAAKITADKRKEAIEDVVDKVQNAVDEGSNFSEAAAANKLPITTTPLVTAGGTSRADAAYKLPPELAPALKTGFEIAAHDPPEVVTLPNNQGYALVSPAEVVPAAPAPFATIRDQVSNDWINAQAIQRARDTANRIAARASQGVSLAQAVKESGVALPAVKPMAARRIQIAQAQGEVAAPMRALFTLTTGKSRAVADTQGRGFFVVKVSKVTPGNALLQPGLVSQMQSELQDALSQDYAQEFLAAVRADMKVKRNESAIQAVKARITANGGG